MKYLLSFLLLVSIANAFYYVVPPQSDEIWKKLDELNSTVTELNSTVADLNASVEELNATVEDMEIRVPDVVFKVDTQPGRLETLPLPQDCSTGHYDLDIAVRSVSALHGVNDVRFNTSYVSGNLQLSTVCYDSNGLPCVSVGVDVEVWCLP